MVVDQRVAQLVLLVADVENDVRRLRALLDAEALGHRTGDDVAHDHLQRNDRHLAADLVAVVDRLDVVGLDAGLLELLENNRRNGIVQHALSLDRGLLDVVESRSRILVVDDDLIGIVGAENLFCLALVEHFELFHGVFVFLVFIDSLFYSMLKSTRMGRWSEGCQKFASPSGSRTGSVKASVITSACVIRSQSGRVQ